MCSSRCTWACPHVGFPIRTSPAQTAAHTSPELFAVYRVLRRHLTPQAFTVRPCSFSATPAAETLTFSSRQYARRIPPRVTSFSFFACYALGNEPAQLRCPAPAASTVACSRCLAPSAQSRNPLGCVPAPLANATPTDKNDPTSCRAANIATPELCLHTAMLFASPASRSIG